MTAAEWAILVPAIVALIGAVVGYLKAVAASNSARRASVHATSAKFSAAGANITANNVRRTLEDHLDNVAAHVAIPAPEPEAVEPGNVYTLPTESDNPPAS